MKNKFSFKSIRSKMIFGFSIVLIGLLFLGGYTIYILNNVNNATEEVLYEELPILIGDERLAYTMANRLSVARAYMLTGDPNFKELFNEYTEQAIEYETMIRDAGGNTERFNTLIDQTVEWRQDIIDNVLDVYDRGNEELAVSNLNSTYIVARELMQEYESLATTRGDNIIDRQEGILADGLATFIVVIVVVLIVLVLTVVTALLTSNSISRPVGTVMNRMQLIADGDLTSKPLEVKSDDEIGKLTTATNEMSNSMREILNQIQVVSETVSSQSEELTNSSNEVMNGSEQIASTMQEIAAGTESQANNATDLSSNMQTFTLKIQETNEYGESVQESTNDVYEMTTEGAELMRLSVAQMAKIDETVHQAVGKVEGLDKHTQEITELVSVIQDIAEQTNLLALNAAIEAARAGEHGAGFAVVADEVRKLAEQSSSSVTNITDIVSRIQSESTLVVESLKDGYQDVTEGSQQVTTTGETFGRIREAITETVAQVEQISSNLNEIATNNERMNGSVQEIAAISEESAAGVEEVSASTEQTNSAMQEVAASSEDLSKLAEELHVLVSRFKI
ncbi:methyl-accepting chemotaxis protein [Oceanobacillus sp. CAU 1775]